MRLSFRIIGQRNFVEKWGELLLYCGAEKGPLQFEGITSKTERGEGNLSNLTIHFA
jgi:hypothetical protein